MSYGKESRRRITLSKLSKECEIRRLEALECLECSCYMYCTMDTCINDIDLDNEADLEAYGIE